MRPDDIRSILRQIPLEAFRLVLTDGTTYDIRHPDLIMVDKATVAIGFPASKIALPAAQRDVIVAPLHIIRIEPLESSGGRRLPNPLTERENLKCAAQ